MKEKRDVIRYLKEEGKNITIPESITPEQMRKRLEQMERETEVVKLGDEDLQGNKRTEKRRKLYAVSKYMVAACLVLVVGTVVVWKTNILQLWNSRDKAPVVK